MPGFLPSNLVKEPGSKILTEISLKLSTRVAFFEKRIFQS